MNTDYILRTDVLDLVFENRNKAYGAYTLRKFYPSRLLWSLGGMSVLVVILSALSLIPGTASQLVIAKDHIFGNIPPARKVSEEAKPKQERKMKSNESARKKDSGLPVVVKEKITDTLQTETAVDIVGLTDENEKEGDPGISFPSSYGNAQFIPEAVVVPQKPDLLEPTRSPEIMPQYPGGITALRKFLERNLTNPRDLGQGERIAVKMQFIVGVDGRLKAFELVEDGGAEFNEEVIRVLKKMPVWIPGKSNGQNVSVYYTIPVKFISED